MGIQRKIGDRRNHVKRSEPKSDNFYLKTIQSVYAKAAECNENATLKTIAHRMCLSGTNRPPVSTSRLASVASHQPGQIIAVVSTITNDPRFLQLPKMTVCALHFTQSAKARIEKAGGKCITFDDLILENPKMENVFMLQGKRSHRKEVAHFGSAGIDKHIKAKGNYSGCKGRKRQLHGMKW